MSLAVIAQALGMSAPGLLKRFGSKEALLSQALLPTGPPAWIARLSAPPGPDPLEDVVAILVEICEDFRQVGPALAALRMSPGGIADTFDPGLPGPPRIARDRLAAWLAHLPVEAPAVTADLLLGAAEARGFLSWVGPQMVSPQATDAWARQVAQRVLPEVARAGRGR